MGPLLSPSAAGRLGNEHPALRHCWHPVGSPADFGPAPVRVELCGGAWEVGVDREGSWHAAEVGGAAAGAVAVHLGLVWVAPAPPLAPLPDAPETADARFVAVPAPPWEWRASAGRMTDGAADLAHIPFVHRATFGNPDEVRVDDYPVDVDAGGWRATARYRHSTKPLRASRGTGESWRPVPRTVTVDYTVPFSVRLRLEYPEEDVVITSLFLHQPLAHARTRLWCVNLRNDILDGRCTPEEATSLQQLVNDEDRRLLEAFHQPDLPLDLRAEVHLRADRITLAVRRGLHRLVREAAAAG